jgi:hypothetical protein
MIFTKQNRDKAIEQLDFWFAKGLKVKIDAVRPIRSLPQNRYLHGVVFNMISEVTGYTLNEAKDELKELFLSVGINGKKIIRNTSELSTKELEDFAENCRRFASMNLGINIPLPNEVTDEMLEEIMKYEKYL